MFALGFPLLLVPFVIYNIVVFIFRLPDDIWTTSAATVHMMSGQDWILTWEDILLAFSILLLWVEIVKSTRIGMRSVMDHLLAMALFVGMLVEFLLVRQAGTSTFFLLDDDRAGRRVGRLHHRHAQRPAPDRDRQPRAGGVSLCRSS